MTHKATRSAFGWYFEGLWDLVLRRRLLTCIWISIWSIKCVRPFNTDVTRYCGAGRTTVACTPDPRIVASYIFSCWIAGKEWQKSNRTEWNNILLKGWKHLKFGVTLWTHLFKGKKITFWHASSKMTQGHKRLCVCHEWWRNTEDDSYEWGKSPLALYSVAQMIVIRQFYLRIIIQIWK